MARKKLEFLNNLCRALSSGVQLPLVVVVSIQAPHPHKDASVDRMALTSP